MNHKWHYDKLIETRRNRIIENNVYYERHHIIPRSMGGDNSKKNLVSLTAREHYIAHWLLWKIYQNKETKAAFLYMNNLKIHTIFSSIAFQEIREAGPWNKGLAGTIPWNKGLKGHLSKEALENISASQKLRSNESRVISEEKRWKLSEEVKQRMSKSQMGHPGYTKGKKMSQESNFKKSEKMIIYHANKVLSEEDHKRRSDSAKLMWEKRRLAKH